MTVVLTALGYQRLYLIALSWITPLDMARLGRLPPRDLSDLKRPIDLLALRWRPPRTKTTENHSRIFAPDRRPQPPSLFLQILLALLRTRDDSPRCTLPPGNATDPVQSRTNKIPRSVTTKHPALGARGDCATFWHGGGASAATAHQQDDPNSALTFIDPVDGIVAHRNPQLIQ